MKFLGIWTTSLLALHTLAAPAHVLRRKENVTASTTDVAILGFASTNNGTTGGKGGETITVSTYDQLLSAATDDTPRIIIVSGTIQQPGRIRVGSNKTILGKDSNAKLIGTGLYIKGKKNVIVRNLTVQKVLAENGDAIGIQESTNVWIDHCDLSSDRDHDKDFYDGLLDITHAADFVTVSNNYLHDHWKSSLVGHSDNNGAEDTGHLRVTYYGNYWHNLNSRGPSLRFGTGHILNNLYDNVNDGINTRDGAQVFVDGNVFLNSSRPLYSTDGGFATVKDNDFGGAKNAAPAGKAIDVPYKFNMLPTASVKDAVLGSAGATLSF